MPGLIRGVARTAVIAGTATTVSNRVSRRQGQKWAQQEEQQMQQQAPAPAQQRPAPPAESAIDQLKELGELKSQGDPDRGGVRGPEGQDPGVLASSLGSMDSQPPSECDLAVVGGGILGMAVARELSQRRPGARLCVLEAEPRLGSHQTGRSSGVIHAGIYYEPGSLKARLCVEGARSLYTFCEERDIPYRRSGKLVVATGESELGRLDELERRGEANGVPGLTRLGAEEIAEVEPNARGVAALHSPATGVVDFVAVAEAYAADVEAAGGTIHRSTRVIDADPGDAPDRDQAFSGLDSGIGDRVLRRPLV